MINAREIALTALMDVETGNTFSNVALQKALKKNQFEDKEQRAFISRLFEGIIEYQITLDYVLNLFSKTKLNKCKPLIRCLLRMGAYQILFMDSVPDSAAVNEAVKLARAHGFAGLSGFVNGVLRSLARDRDKIKYPEREKDLVKALSVLYSTPEWLVEKLCSDYPKQAETILSASFENRPTAIRVNRRKTDRETLRNMLGNLTVCDGHYDENALLISGYDYLRRLTGYREGYFTVQDESSMCALRAAGIKEGDLVLDVCAAPGGKTTAAAEFAGENGRVIATDISEEKLELIEENVERLGLSNVEVSAADATELRAEYKEKADVVIADLPCSGLGVMGRKNDIKYRVTPKQLQDLCALQKEILSVVCQYVKPDGTLAYSTCTINPEENEHQVDAFLAEHPEFSLKESRLFLQGVDQCDGFYYAILKKHTKY